jgi:hypothetical protein
MKYYMIPEKDIKRLEKARISLNEIATKSEKQEIPVNLGRFMHVTPAMYEITHRRYSKIPFPRLIQKLTSWGLWGKKK